MKNPFSKVYDNEGNERPRKPKELLAFGIGAAALAAGSVVVIGSAVEALTPDPTHTVKYIVSHGDTGWGIAGQLNPDGDPRIIADQIGAEIKPGDIFLVQVPGEAP